MSYEKLISTGDIESSEFEIGDIEKGVAHIPDIYTTPQIKRSLTLPKTPVKEFKSSRVMDVVVSGRSIIRRLKF